MLTSIRFDRMCISNGDKSAMEPLCIETQRIPARTPLSVRVPAPLLKEVQRYADKRGITRTEAFLQLVDRGLAAVNDEEVPGSMTSLEQKVDRILALLQNDPLRQASDLDGTAAIARTIASICKEFSAISKAYLFGSWARGTGRPESDIDLRIEVDRDRPFNLYDLVCLSKLIEQETGRPVDIVSAQVIKNATLAAAIEREKVLVYEREK